jgi:hypothetical protein
MTVFSGPAAGFSAGPAGETTATQELRDRGCMTKAVGIENVMSQFFLDLAYEANVNLQFQPDQLVWRKLPPGNRYSLPPDKYAIVFAAEVKGIASLKENALAFAIPQRTVDGAIEYQSKSRMWCAFLLVPWDGSQIRVATPHEVQARPQDPWLNYRVDGAEFRTLDQWLNEFPPYIGGQLSRNWSQHPQRPPAGNVIQLPRAA